MAAKKSTAKKSVAKAKKTAKRVVSRTKSVAKKASKATHTATARATKVGQTLQRVGKMVESGAAAVESTLKSVEKRGAKSGAKKRKTG